AGAVAPAGTRAAVRRSPVGRDRRSKPTAPSRRRRSPAARTPSPGSAAGAFVGGLLGEEHADRPGDRTAVMARIVNQPFLKDVSAVVWPPGGPVSSPRISASICWAEYPCSAR